MLSFSNRATSQIKFDNTLAFLITFANRFVDSLLFSFRLQSSYTFAFFRLFIYPFFITRVTLACFHSFLTPSLCLPIGEELIPSVLDQLKVNLVVGLGEGAGANVLVRFALSHSSRTLGLVLIHLVSAGVGLLESLKDRLPTFFSAKRRTSEASPEQLIALHRLGRSGSGSHSPSGNDTLMTEISERFQTINGEEGHFLQIIMQKSY